MTVTEETIAEQPSQTDSLRQRAVRGGVFVMVARLAGQLIQWSVTLFVARLLLPDDYGLMASSSVILGFADLFAEAGIGKALVQKKELQDDDLAQAFTFAFFVSTVLYVLLFIIAGPVAMFLERPEFALLLRVSALGLLFTPFRTTAAAILERDLRMGKWSAVQLTSAALQSILVFGLAYAGMGYWALAAGFLSSRIVETVLLCRLSHLKPKLAVPSREAVGLLQFGWHMSATSLFWYFYSNSDFAVLGALLGPIALGYYSVAFQLISIPVTRISATTNQVMFSVYSKLQDDPARIRDWCLRLTALQDFVAMPALAGMALVADDAIPYLLGRHWQPAVLPLQLLCPTGAVMMIGSALPTLLSARGRPDINVRYTAICAVLYPIGFLIAGAVGFQMDGERGGLIGICLLWLLLHPCVVAGYYHFTRGLTGIAPIDMLRRHLPILAAIAVMTAVVMAIKLALKDVIVPIRLTTSVVSGAISYALCIALTARASILADALVVWQQLRGRRQ